MGQLFERNAKTVEEAFCVGAESVDFTIRDFWRWAYSDLLDNAARGVLSGGQERGLRPKLDTARDVKGHNGNGPDVLRTPGASGYPDYFAYWTVRNTVNDLRARTHGTIFDTVTREIFNIAETVLAPESVASAFNAVISPLMNRILAELRDSLLPELVSGKVTVGGIDVE